MPLTTDVERRSVTPRSASQSAVSSHFARKKRFVETETASDARREITLTHIAIAGTLGGTILAAAAAIFESWDSPAALTSPHVLAGCMFLFVAGFLIYGSLVYQISRLGYFTRLSRHRRASDDALLRFYRRAHVPTVAVLVPAYKEELEVVISPEHAHQLEISAAIGEWATIENAKRALVELLADDAAHHVDAAPIPLWDFSGYSSITTESFPEPGSRAEMRFYWDSSHFKDNVGDFILDRLFGVTDPRRAVPADFGVPLTADTIETALARVREDQLAYRRRNPVGVMWIRSLVDVSGQDSVHGLDRRAMMAAP